MTAISAAAMRVRTMADGSLRIEVEVEPQDAQQAFALFGRPGAPMALAALAVGHAAVKESEPLQQSDKPKGGARSQWVAMRCNEPAFQQWLCRAFPLDWRRLPSETASGVAANVVRKVCGIESRAELDANPAAAKYFDELIRAPYALHCGGVTV
jgi:hypothetical protein